MKQIVTSAKAPSAVGPYSQAVQAGEFLFLAGQIPLDPVSGDITGTTAAAQTEQVLKNIYAVLQAGGCSFSDVVKTTVFLTDLKDFAEMNEVYEHYFGEEFPARSTIQVAALPRSALVEIEVIAKLPNS